MYPACQASAKEWSSVQEAKAWHGGEPSSLRAVSHKDRAETYLSSQCASQEYFEDHENEEGVHDVVVHRLWVVSME